MKSIVMIASILIVTSKKNFQWMSMSEIIPGIEDQWLKLTNESNVKVKVLDVNESPIKDIILKSLKCTHVVFTCFTPELAQLSIVLREKMSFSGKFLFYAHGLAPVSFWPFHYWKISSILKEGDFLISSSLRDVEACKLAYNKINIALLPFPIKQIEVTSTDQSDQFLNNGNDFVYVGRISCQKNIHTLLYSIFILKKEYSEKILFHLFGKEDNLGSPNMGMKSNGYLLFLKKQVKDLGLENNIIFYGFLEREKLESLLSRKKYCFISTSIHGDENFGMAACRSLSYNNSAILSDWGGHSDFKAESLYFVKVYSSIIGPYICPRELSKVILTYLSNTKTDNGSKFIDRSFQKLKNFIKEISHDQKRDSIPVTLSDLSVTVLDRWTQYRKKATGNDCVKIFEGYDDTIFHQFAEKYGAIVREELTLNKEMFLVSWATILDDKIYVNDPHRGKKSIEIKGDDYGVKICDIELKSLKISEDSAKHLFEVGYLHY